MESTANAEAGPAPRPDTSKLLECLPEALRVAETTITAVTAGNSGAGVFIVDCAGAKSILKVTAQAEPVEGWKRAIATQSAAAEFGLAPAVLYVDEERRAVLSAFVADHSFPAFFGNPVTRDNAIAALGRMVRAIHSIAPLPEHSVADPNSMFAMFWNGLQPDASGKDVVPAFARDAWQQIADERAPDSDRVAVLSHNDMNPTNIVFDGERLLMLDWQTAALNDPYYDLATIAMFLRFDERASLQLLSAYDNASVVAVPPLFKYFRRVTAALCGSAFLFVARKRGYNTADTGLTIDAVPSLGDIYAALRSGTLNLGLPEGQWRFGLALLKESLVS